MRRRRDPQGAPAGRDAAARAAAWVTAVLEERLALATPSRRLRLALTDDVVRLHTGDRPVGVLDAGCADGLLTLALARRHPRWRLLGVDLHEDLLPGARRRAQARGLGNVAFARADVTAPLDRGAFDVVLAIECLSEIPDHQAALRELAASVVPGGLFVVQVPERGWRPILPGSAATWRAEVRHGFGHDELAGALREAGLEVVEVRDTFRFTTVLAQELADRLKGRSLLLRAAAFPFLAGAVRLERAGVTGGRAHALLAVARRPSVSAPLTSS